MGRGQREEILKEEVLGLTFEGGLRRDKSGGESPGESPYIYLLMAIRKPSLVMLYLWNFITRHEFLSLAANV